MNFIKFKPILMRRIWGGNSIGKELSRYIPENERVGESWDISDRPEANCIAVGGEYDGLSIRNIILKDSEKIMGKKWGRNCAFPILVKWLDAADRLSVQVHPDEDMAKKYAVESKSENWYIYKVEPNAKMVVGLKSGVTRETFGKSLDGEHLKNLLNYEFPKAEESILIPAGCVHAIGAGILILEIQQNSDTTYRVYDWNRKDTDGKPRKLHIEQSLDSIHFNAPKPKSLSTEGRDVPICTSPHFSIRAMSLNDGESINLQSGDETRVLSVVRGSLMSSCGGKIGLSESVILPFANAQHFTAVGDAKILLTENFSKYQNGQQ